MEEGKRGEENVTLKKNQSKCFSLTIIATELKKRRKPRG